MKEQYTSPEVKIIEFNVEDVITTSMNNGGTVGDYNEKGDIQIP